LKVVRSEEFGPARWVAGSLWRKRFAPDSTTLRCVAPGQPQG